MDHQTTHNIVDYLSSNINELFLSDSAPETLEAAALSLFYKPENSISLSKKKTAKELFVRSANKHAAKTILFIPANGIGKVNDFSLFRIAQELKDMGYSCVLLTRGKIDLQFEDCFSKIYKVDNATDFFNLLCHIPYSKLLYRGWMHAYPFGAYLCKYFRNVIFNIKDWNFSSEDEYTFLFGKKSSLDFDAIRYGFQNAERIVSHYTDEEYSMWAKEYNVSPEKFSFLPEYCNEQNFNTKTYTPSKFPHIVHAGSLPPSSYPEEFFWTKGYLRTIKKSASKNIYFSCVIPEGYYERIINDKPLYSDIMYENCFNKKFSLRKGRDLDPTILNQYHFGHFTVEYTTLNCRLNRYAVPSKVAFYLEAGIPLLVNKEMRSVARLTQENKIGIVYSNNDLINLDQRLHSSKEEYLSMIENVKRFRKKFCYDQANLEALFR